MSAALEPDFVYIFAGWSNLGELKAIAARIMPSAAGNPEPRTAV
jgi:hypothetical protein